MSHPAASTLSEEPPLLLGLPLAWESKASCPKPGRPLPHVGEVGAPLGEGFVVLPLVLGQGSLGMDVPLGAASPKPFISRCFFGAPLAVLAKLSNMD